MRETFLGLTSTGWSAVTAMAAVATLLVAGAAAWVALRQLKQSRQLSEEQARPYIIAFIEESEADRQILDFVVRNVGLTAARNVRLSATPPYVRAKDIPGHEFMQTKFLNAPIAVVPPGGELRTFLDTTRDLARQAEPGVRAFVVSATYEDRFGRQIVESFEIDVEAHMGTLRTDVHGLHHIAKSLRALAKQGGATSF